MYINKISLLISPEHYDTRLKYFKICSGWSNSLKICKRPIVFLFVSVSQIIHHLVIFLIEVGIAYLISSSKLVLLKNSYKPLPSVLEKYLPSENYLGFVPINKMLKWETEGLSNKPVRSESQISLVWHY